MALFNRREMAGPSSRNDQNRKRQLPAALPQHIDDLIDTDESWFDDYAANVTDAEVAEIELRCEQPSDWFDDYAANVTDAELAEIEPQSPQQPAHWFDDYVMNAVEPDVIMPSTPAVSYGKTRAGVEAYTSIRLSNGTVVNIPFAVQLMDPILVNQIGSGRPFARADEDDFDEQVFDDNANELMSMRLLPQLVAVAKDMLVVEKNTYKNYPNNAPPSQTYRSKVLHMRCRYNAEQLKKIVNNQYYVAVRMFLDAMGSIIENEIEDQPDNFKVKVVLKLNDMPTYDRGGEWSASCFQMNEGAAPIVNRALDYFMNFLTSNRSFDIFNRVTVIINAFPAVPPPVLNASNGSNMRQVAGGSNNVPAVDRPLVSTSYKIKQGNVQMILAYDDLSRLKTVVDPAEIVKHHPELNQACLPVAVTLMTFKRAMRFDRDLAISLISAWNGAPLKVNTVCNAPYSQYFSTPAGQKPAWARSAIYWNGFVAIMEVLQTFKPAGSLTTAAWFRKNVRKHRQAIVEMVEKCPEIRDIALKYGIGQIVRNEKLQTAADNLVQRSAAVISNHVAELEVLITDAFNTAVEYFQNNGFIYLVKQVKSMVMPAEQATGRYELRQVADILKVINDMRITVIGNPDNKSPLFIPVISSDEFEQIMPQSTRHYLFDCVALVHGEAGGAATQAYNSYDIEASPGMVFEETAPRQIVFIVQHNNHVFGMPSFRSFMRSVQIIKFFCHLCHKAYATEKELDPTAHLCRFTCRFCYRTNCNGVGKSIEQLHAMGEGIRCQQCQRWFPSSSVTQCYENHKLLRESELETLTNRSVRTKRFTICDMVQNCALCNQLINKFRFPSDYVHECGEMRCSHCRAHHNKGDYCYFSAYEGSERSKALRTNMPLYVDFETAFSSRPGNSYEARELLPFHVTVGMLLRRKGIERLEELNGQPFISCSESSLPDEKNNDRKYYYATIRTFDGLSCNRELVQWMLTSPLCSNRAIIAHNGNRFDFSFVLNEFLHQGVKPSIVYDGHSQMVRMKVVIKTSDQATGKTNRELHFVDSFKYMTQSLESMHQNLVGSAVGRAKQYFPYDACSIENATKGYLDAFPTRELFGLKMQGDADFEQWYAAESELCKNQPYQLSAIMKTYCNNDVKLLAEAFTAFLTWLRNMDIVVNPLVDVSTVAGMAQKTFLASHYHFQRKRIVGNDKSVTAAQLRHEWADRSIAIISDTPGVNHSKGSDKFFAFLNKHCGVAVFCNESGGERKIACEGRPFSVDGYMELPVDAARAKITELVEQFKMDVTDVTDALNKNGVVKVVIEYQGCYYHGCRLCMDPEADHYASGLKMAERCQRSETRTVMISSRGYVVLELRPCVFQKLLSKSALGKQYHQLKATPPYKHRDALFGGRCENLSRFYKACTCEACQCNGCTAAVKTNKTKCTICENFVLGLCYVDITSLYPYVLAACPYPVGAPEHLLKPPLEDLNNWFGFAQIDILPPRNLFIPLLPIRDVKGRLLFGLCTECMNTKRKDNCDHSDEQRMISGIYFTEEIKKAVEVGYVVKAVYQVYHWQKKSVDIFRPYIQHFFEKKMLCDGLTDELKALAPNLTGEAQVEAIKERVREIGKLLCGIILKLEEPFKTNKALRFIVKLLLNSLWGRFGMQSDGKKTEFFTEDEAEKVFALMNNPNVEVTHYIICDGPNNCNIICIEYRPKKGATGDEAKVNIPIAAMTTAWARLRMYDIFSAVADPTDIMYYDTDSMVAVESVVPQLTKYMEYPFMLGQLKSELKPGERIVEFWCCGPKSYMYTTNLGHVVHHYKGISLCDEVKETLCSTNVAPIVEHHECGEKSESLQVRQFQIVKTSIVPGNLHARNIQKILQSTNDMKRKWIGTSAMTYPYGFDFPAESS